VSVISTTDLAPRPPLHRRVATVLAAVIALMLAGAIAPPPSPADPGLLPPFVQIKAGSHSHLPILICRARHSVGTDPEVSFARNVAAVEYPDLVGGTSLIIVAPSISQFRGNTVTAQIDMFLYDPARGTYQLVGMDLRPLRNTDGKPRTVRMRWSGSSWWCWRSC
jgi:hypothetical protein